MYRDLMHTLRETEKKRERKSKIERFPCNSKSIKTHTRRVNRHEGGGSHLCASEILFEDVANGWTFEVEFKFLRFYQRFAVKCEMKCCPTNFVFAAIPIHPSFGHFAIHSLHNIHTHFYSVWCCQFVVFHFEHSLSISVGKVKTRKFSSYFDMKTGDSVAGKR